MTVQAQRTRPGADVDEARRLIEATWTVVSQIGSLDISVRDILSESGLATKAFYRHFRSKDELLARCLEEGAHLMARSLRRRIVELDDAVLACDAWVRTLAGLAAPGNERYVPWAVAMGKSAESFAVELQATQKLLVEVLAEVISAGIHAGRMSSPSPERDAWMVFDLCLSVARRHLQARAAITADDEDVLLDFVHRALMVRSPADIVPGGPDGRAEDAVSTTSVPVGSDIDVDQCAGRADHRERPAPFG